MPMRVECKHYESRTYASGEAMRMCRLDLAPDAPWRCPDDCSKYERRYVDVGFTVGSLAEHPTPTEPDLAGAAELLDAAEDIINTIGPDVLAEVERERDKQSGGRRLLKRLFRRR